MSWNVPDGIMLEDVVGEYETEPDVPILALERNRAQQAQLAAMAEWAAEKVWPGYGALAQRIVQRERELLAQVNGASA